MTQHLDATEEVTLAAAADLCRCSSKTLIRDAQNPQVPLRIVLRDGRNYVTIGDLMAAGRYVAGAESGTEQLSRAALEARILQLEEDLARVRAALDVQAALRSQAERFIKSLEESLLAALSERR